MKITLGRMQILKKIMQYLTRSKPRDSISGAERNEETTGRLP